MTEPQGWIKVHRKILENPIFNNPDAFMLWMQLLLRVNHKDAKVMVGNSIVDIKRGQFLTGRNKLSEYTGINRSKLERLLKMLESEHQIEQQKTTKYRVISITNYDKYQSAEQQVSNKRATSEQQVSTNKNDKNVNNDKNESKAPRAQFKAPTQIEVENYFLSKGFTFEDAKRESVKFYSYYDSKGWLVGKSKMKNWKSAVTGWIARSSDKPKQELNFNTTGWSE